MSTRYSDTEIKEWIRRIDDRTLHVVCNEWEQMFLAVVRAKLVAREQLSAQQVYHLERVIMYSGPVADIATEAGVARDTSQPNAV